MAKTISLTKKMKVFFKNIIFQIVVLFYQIKGLFVSKNFKKGKTYYNTLEKCYGIYRGNNKFFRTKYVIDNMYGVCFFDSKDVTYTNLQLGMFKDLWIESNADVVNSVDNLEKKVFENE